MLDKCYWQLSNKSEAARHVQIPKGTIGNWLQKVKKLKEDEIRDAGEVSYRARAACRHASAACDTAEAPINAPHESVSTQQNPGGAPEHVMNR